jgi:hypothetical protein
VSPSQVVVVPSRNAKSSILLDAVEVLFVRYVGVFHEPVGPGPKPLEMPP